MKINESHKEDETTDEIIDIDDSEEFSVYAMVPALPDGGPNIEKAKITLRIELPEGREIHIRMKPSTAYGLAAAVGLAVTSMRAELYPEKEPDGPNN